MGLKAKIGVVLVAVSLATVGAIVTSAPSYAASGYHFYQASYDINAWNGGPDVAAYAGNVNTDDFTPVANGSYYNLVYTGGGAYNGYCIGAFGNNSGSNTTELDTCSAGGTGSGTPWGANFTPQWSGGLVAFYCPHTGLYLGAGDSNGSLFVLNHSEVFYHEASA